MPKPAPCLLTPAHYNPGPCRIKTRQSTLPAAGLGERSHAVHNRTDHMCLPPHHTRVAALQLLLLLQPPARGEGAPCCASCQGLDGGRAIVH
jgi:hypothetical protein